MIYIRIQKKFTMILKDLCETVKYFLECLLCGIYKVHDPLHLNQVELLLLVIHQCGKNMQLRYRISN